VDFLITSAVFLVSLIASIIGVIVSGSSLIVVPALAALGIPLSSVIATNRLFVTAFVLVGALSFARKKVKIDAKLVAGLALVKIAGAASGSFFIISISPSQLKPLACLLVIAGLAAIFFFRNRKKAGIAVGRKHIALAVVAVFIIGIYDGMVGGGSGLVSRALLMPIFGWTIIEATAADLAMSFFSSLASSLVFISSGAVDYALLLPMLAGGAIGAYAGTHFAVKADEKWMERLFYAAAVLLAASLILS
jgi:uncharacterized membrane protein YfcA